MNTLERKHAALNAIHDHTDYGIDRTGSEGESTLPIYTGDMLLNILILCDMEGIDFDEQLEKAREQFEYTKQLRLCESPVCNVELHTDEMLQTPSGEWYCDDHYPL